MLPRTIYLCRRIGGNVQDSVTCVGLIRLKNARKNILLTQDMIC
jgi:hypothetical protein